MSSEQLVTDRQSDWLWYWLKRVPPDAALQLALESKLQASSGIVANIEANVEDILDEVHGRAIAEDDEILLFLEMPTDGITHIYAALTENGYQVEGWQPYFDEAAKAASAAVGRGNADLWFALTGHYVPLPWQRFLEPADSYLRPFYEAPLTDQGAYLAILVKKREGDAIEPLPSVGFGEVGISAEVPPPIPPIPAQSLLSLSLTQSATPKILLALAILFAMFAQMTMRGEMPSMGQSTVLWLLSLAALFGATLPRRSFDKSLLWKLGGAVGAFLLSFLAATQSNTPLLALILWLFSIGLAGFSLRLLQSPPVAREERNPTEKFIVYGLLFTILLAFILRAYRLTTHPWIIDGIEAQLGLDALAVRDLFGTAWLTNPTLPLFLQKGMIGIFGRTPLALRLLSPLIGTASIIGGWWIGRKLWNDRVGLVAAMMIAFNHTLIHFSHLGTTNIYEPLLTLFAMGGIGTAWHVNTRRAWLGTGLAVGLCAYFFTTVHLLPIMLAIWLVAAGLSGGLHERWRGALAMLAFAAVIALPQIRFYLQNPILFWDRAQVLGILQNGWLRNEVISTNENVVVILARRLFISAAGYNATLTTDGSFDPGVPLINSIVGVLFLLGLGMAIFHLRQMRYTVLLIGYGVTVVFGDALLLDSPHSRRLLIALPLVLLLAARAFVWGLDRLQITREKWAVTGLGVCLFLMGGWGYFGRYQSGHTFADPNSEAAYLTATYLDSLEGEWTAYLHGAPSLYTSFSTIPFLADEFQAGINLHDVPDSSELPFPNSSNTTHIFTVNRLGDIALVQERFPDGQIESVNGFYGNPLIVIMEIQP